MAGVWERQRRGEGGWEERKRKEKWKDETAKEEVRGRKEKGVVNKISLKISRYMVYKQRYEFNVSLLSVRTFSHASLVAERDCSRWQAASSSPLFCTILALSGCFSSTNFCTCASRARALSRCAVMSASESVCFCSKSCTPSRCLP